MPIGYDPDPSPQEWLPHIQVKSLHFTAVAQYRKSKDEIESGSNYGVELARLNLAQENVKRAYDIARRAKVSTHVLHDTQVRAVLPPFLSIVLIHV